jgi:hypothetical protein
MLILLCVHISDYVLEGSEGTPFSGLANYDCCRLIFCFSCIVCWFCSSNTQFITISTYIVFTFFVRFLGGYYYGKIKFPQEYPYKPPGIRCLLVAAFLIIRIFMYLIFNNQVHTFYNVAWQHLMGGSWHRKRSVYQWAIVSSFTHWKTNRFVS